MTRRPIVVSIVAALVCGLGFVALRGQTTGGWTTHSAYPGLSITKQSCVTNDGQIFCVGGERKEEGFLNLFTSLVFDSAFFAPIQDSGLGAWHETRHTP